MMNDTNNLISKSSMELLRQIKGQCVESVSVEHANSHEKSLTQMVILHLSTNDISFWSEEMENRPDEYPDLAQINVYQETRGRWDALGDRLVRFPINEAITSIEIITDYVTIQPKNEMAFRFANTKGLVIKFRSKMLLLEKSNYWSETWKVSLLSNDIEYIWNDEWADEDDLETTYMVHTKGKPFDYAEASVHSVHF